jgi:peptidoglycan hydrolase-like protein with peptidoglycan-binding domain
MTENEKELDSEEIEEVEEVENKKLDTVEVKPKPVEEKKAVVGPVVPTVDVSLGALTYSLRKKRSMSVVIMQERLTELGYSGARADFSGWFSTGTRRAVEAWQKDNRLEVTGECSPVDMEFLFDGTNVVIVP